MTGVVFSAFFMLYWGQARCVLGLERSQPPPTICAARKWRNILVCRAARLFCTWSVSCRPPNAGINGPMADTMVWEKCGQHVSTAPPETLASDFIGRR